MKEVITIQCGPVSNYVGCHYFNIQEAGFSYNPSFVPDIDNDILFREGSCQGKDIYTPRLLAIDCVDSMGYLTESGALINNPGPLKLSNTWDKNRVEQMKQPPPLLEKSEFMIDLEKYYKSMDSGNLMDQVLKSHYEMDGRIVSWTDYLIPRLHPRTFNMIPYKYRENFNILSQGTSVWNSDGFNEKFSNNLRLFAEECDFMQGFQLICDVENGFSGLSTSCHEYIKEEFNKKSILSILPLFSDGWNSLNKSTRIRQIFNLAQSVSKIVEFCDLIVPLSLTENINSDEIKFRSYQNFEYEKCQYHIAAVLATAFDVLTIPYRKRDNVTNMSDTFSTLNSYGRILCGTQMSFPFPSSSPLSESEPLLENLTPYVNCEPQNTSSLQVTCKGFVDQNSRCEAELEEGGNVEDLSNYIKSYFMKSGCNPTFYNIYSVQQNLRIPVTYPNILRNHVLNKNKDNAQKQFGVIEESKVVVALQNTSNVRSLIRKLTEITRKYRSTTIPNMFFEMEPDEIRQVMEKLKFVERNYETHEEI